MNPLQSYRFDFSIIVPTYNRPGQLKTCLQAVARLDYPPESFEVIVVDDGGKSPLDTVVAPFRGQLNLLLFTQANAGPAAARNAGAARARSRFLAFTDDDCAPAIDWLKVLAARFIKTPDQIIGGRILNALPDNAYSTASQVILDAVYAYYNADPSRARFFASNNLVLPTDGFRALGGFDATFTTSEDRDLCDRWLYHGYRMTYAPEAMVDHAHPLTFRSFWRQHFNYGRGAFRYHRVRACRGSGRLRQEFKFYAWLPNLLRGSFSELRGRRRLLLAFLLVVWQVANAAGFFWERVGRKRPKVSEHPSRQASINDASRWHDNP